ncbi:YdeI/OmpD-associated family protein [Flavitalea flava]
MTHLEQFILTVKHQDPKVDDYISKSADFAKPILQYLRQLIHDTCPEVEEIMKWGIPHFDYNGDMMCILSAYKHHCSFSLFKAELMDDPKIKQSVESGKKMGFMDKIKTISDLPTKKVLTGYLKEAMALNEKGLKKPKPVKKESIEIEVPDFFLERLNKDPKAKKLFESKSPSFRKEYAKWLIDAKTDDTREKRVAQSLQWIAEGKGRFWQYEKK